MSDDTQKLTEESIGFATHELVACPTCSRRNPPDRTNCIYCGAVTSETLSQNMSEVFLRPLEDWENGTNLILDPATIGHHEFEFDKAAKLLGVETAQLELIVSSGRSLPIARVAPGTADAATKKLDELGLTVRQIQDVDLAPHKPPLRLRSVVVGNGSISVRLFNTNDTIMVDRVELVLIVTGRVTESRRDETTQKKRTSKKLLEESETASHERLVDLYFDEDKIGYRIVPFGFDFSVLGNEKGIRAVENITLLVERLRDAAPSARFIDDYDSVSRLLDVVWPPQQQKESHGVRRQGFGRIEFANTYIESRLEQFTRYSRMHRHLL